MSRQLGVFLLINGDTMLGEVESDLIEKNAAFQISNPIVRKEVTATVPREGVVKGTMEPIPVVNPVFGLIPIDLFTLVNYIGYGFIENHDHPLYQQYDEFLEAYNKNLTGRSGLIH